MSVGLKMTRVQGGFVGVSVGVDCDTIATSKDRTNTSIVGNNELDIVLSVLIAWAEIALKW